MNKEKNKIVCMSLLILIIILLYLLIKRFGYIENHSPLVPTGNIDVFEIDCDCLEEVIEDTSSNIIPHKVICKNKKNNTIEDIITPTYRDGEETIIEEEEEELRIIENLFVFDDYKLWDAKELRIFDNPAYEYRNIIAPGSQNSYTFVIKNDNDFDVNVDILFTENNKNKINMKYKLIHDGNYLLGTNSKYVDINSKKIRNLDIPAYGEEIYNLDWKWIDSSNDTKIGFDKNSKYKLSILVGAK